VKSTQRKRKTFTTLFELDLIGFQHDKWVVSNLLHSTCVGWTEKGWGWEIKYT
jgi:hypothetical protein